MPLTGPLCTPQVSVLFRCIYEVFQLKVAELFGTLKGFSHCVKFVKPMVLWKLSSWEQFGVNICKVVLHRIPRVDINQAVCYVLLLSASVEKKMKIWSLGRALCFFFQFR